MFLYIFSTATDKQLGYISYEETVQNTTRFVRFRGIIFDSLIAFSGTLDDFALKILA